ncbi:hypothetical protein [Microbacterium sp. CJ88]|uniref:hypothetical protein n=1 Tax=Microbacterium sp. CJ88 TaxID=3445672 RepID=UPI003F65F5B9
MTLIESAPPRPDLPVEPVWREVEAGFWVASTEGMFLGTVERHDDARFFARDSTRTYLGEWTSLSLAQGAVLSVR